MNEPNKAWILEEKFGRDIICYLLNYSLHHHPNNTRPQNPNCDWVLRPVATMIIENAIVFRNKLKAQRIADLLNKQLGEGGWRSKYKVKEI